MPRSSNGRFCLRLHPVRVKRPMEYQQFHMSGTITRRYRFFGPVFRLTFLFANLPFKRDGVSTISLASFSRILIIPFLQLHLLRNFHSGPPGKFVVSRESAAYDGRAHAENRKFRLNWQMAQGLPADLPRLPCAPKRRRTGETFRYRGEDVERSDDCNFQSQLARRAARADRSRLRGSSQGLQQDNRPAPAAHCSVR